MVALEKVSSVACGTCLDHRADKWPEINFPYIRSFLKADGQRNRKSGGSERPEKTIAPGRLKFFTPELPDAHPGTFGEGNGITQKRSVRCFENAFFFLQMNRIIAALFCGHTRRTARHPHKIIPGVGELKCISSEDQANRHSGHDSDDKQGGEDFEQGEGRDRTGP